MPVYPVKVYRNEETRRFLCEIADESQSGYKRLVDKIHQLFPDLDIKTTRLMWIDEDNDIIIMSSNDELMAAIQTLPVENPILRVYLVDAVNADLAKQDKPDRDHVWCDGCSNLNRGIRFKCLVCPYFDLCSGCMGKTPHEHPMIQIALPNDKKAVPPVIAAQSPTTNPQGPIKKDKLRYLPVAFGAVSAAGGIANLATNIANWF